MRILSLLFSPTGGTQKTAQLLTNTWGEAETIDLTAPAQDFSQTAIQPDDLVLLSVPSFGGRVPALAAERIVQLKGNGAKCVLLCVYGNRAYEDTLVELNDLAQAANLRPAAAIAAVAEHSIMHQFAAGRPDAQDAAQLQTFAQEIMEKLPNAGDTPLPLPGNRPYKNAGAVPLYPKAGRACTKCGLCAKRCPAQAIDPDNVKGVDSKACISCMRCVVNCPRKARSVNGAMVAAAALSMKKVCSVRKDCELFL